MSESFTEQLRRVEMMATGSPTWDLSDNDLAAIQSVLADRRKLLAALKECADLLDDYSDVNDGEDGPRPNRAMSLLQDVEAVIRKAEGAK